MSEQDNDRLEQFFRKAASKPDVSFNEDDWKKLEVRLEAHDALSGGVKKAGSRLISAVTISIILLFTAGVIVNDHFGVIPPMPAAADGNPAAVKDQAPVAATPAIPDYGVGEELQEPGSPAQTNVVSDSGKEFSLGDRAPLRSDINHSSGLKPDSQVQTDRLVIQDAAATDAPMMAMVNTTGAGRSHASSADVVEIRDEQIVRDFMNRKPFLALRNKQKAIVELPGAEEGETGEAESEIREEHVSDQKDQVTTPRLSLLLSFSPDFSGTSLSQYSAPGKAFGAMIHYHIRSRWSVSAGVIKNNKQYTGDGEDYQPPPGYWNYYTNGKIPASIYGTCDVLEFPLMIQYAIVANGKNRLLAGAGTSSYVMLNESYQYHFDEPNPGAREGWNSQSSSRFLLNMVNLSMGYERQVLPGFMIGIEPYVKIPIEKIGWCNLKLFSTGASVTMRYTILRKKSPFITNRTRGPD